jgi:hypothetical protein
MSVPAEPSDARQIEADISAFLRVLWQDGEIREVRVPRHDRYGSTAIGYFSSPEHVARAVARFDGLANTYVTLNPVDPSLRARAAERIQPRALHAASDGDILRRRWLLVDVDPVRPSGVSSTDAEVEAASAVLLAAVDFLHTLGWPDPVVAMSGNGFHALYGLDLENTLEVTSLIEAVLDRLADRCGQPMVTIDRSVANPARITALIGTMKVKGDNVPDRPHRRSGLVSVPEHIEPVSIEKLRAAAATHDSGNADQPQSHGVGSRLAKILTDAGIAFRPQPPDANGVRWFHIYRCPFHDDGRDFECGLGEAPDGRLSGHCFHPEGVDKGWREFREALGLRVSQSFGGGGLAAPQLDRWPDPIDPAAYHGLAGDVVRAIEVHSEADPVAILTHALVSFGAVVGPRVHAIASDAKHPGRLFAVLVGPTGRGRKGSSAHAVERIIRLADPSFPPTAEGLSSGEGLIYAVRDRITRKTKGADGHPEEIVVDEGVQDKRLLVVETEFSSPLRVAVRDGNTLTATLRRGWDGAEVLQTLTKTSQARSTEPHIAVVGHITLEELRRTLNRTDLVNGFANRFLWPLVRRSKLLPEGEAVPDAVLLELAERLAAVVAWAATPRVLRRDDEAREVWARVYPELSEGTGGLIGAVLGRAEAQVLRISVLYAVLDRSEVIRADHLLAGLAVWTYMHASAEIIFGEVVGDQVADTVLAALRVRGPLTRTEIGAVLSRHADRGRIEQALRGLEAAGLATRSEQQTSGRPTEVWQPVLAHNAHNAQTGVSQ